MSEGSIRRDYGLLLRVTDDWDDSFRYQPRAGYRCTVNTGRDGKADSTLSVEVLREDGSRSTVASYAPAFALEPGTWYTVSASAVGNRITCQIMRATGCWAAPRPSTTRTETATSPPGTTKTTRAPTGGATCASSTRRRPPPAASAARASKNPLPSLPLPLPPASPLPEDQSPYCG